MPTSVTPTLATLREQIKIEGRVKGSDNLDSFIDGVVNELICDYAQKNRYFEFLVTNQVIPTVLNTGTYALPSDFIAMRLIRYKNANGYTWTLNRRSEYIETARGKSPKWFDLAGSSILIFPFDDVPAAETLLLDYYRLPQTLVSASVFPVPKLLATVKLEAIHRVLIYNEKLQAAAALRGEAQENEVRTKPSHH